MTCIVGISHEGRVLLGGDSASTSYVDKEIHCVGNQKVFRNGPYAVGFSGSFRLGSILQYQTELPEPPDDPSDFDRFFNSVSTRPAPPSAALQIASSFPKGGLR